MTPQEQREARALDIVQDRIDHPQLTYRALAEKRGTSLTEVQRAIKALRPDLLGRANNAHHRFDHAAAVADYRTGQFTFDELAVKYDVSHVAISKAIHKADPTLTRTVLRKAPGRKVDARAAYLEYCAGSTMAELANVYNVTSACISMRVNEIEPGVSRRMLAARAQGRNTIEPVA